jgi:hypothetical protein
MLCYVSWFDVKLCSCGILIGRSTSTLEYHLLMRAAHTSRQQGIGQQWVGPATLSPAPPQHRQESKLTSGAASKGACLLGVNNDGEFVVFSFPPAYLGLDRPSEPLWPLFFTLGS